MMAAGLVDEQFQRLILVFSRGRVTLELKDSHPFRSAHCPLHVSILGRTTVANSMYGVRKTRRQLTRAISFFQHGRQKELWYPPNHESLSKVLHDRDCSQPEWWAPLQDIALQTPEQVLMLSILCRLIS
jgi:hypothetical protein